jgi:hypothetical protein
MLMDRMASVVLVLGMAAGPAGVALAAGPGTVPAAGTAAPSAHGAPVMPIARHERTDVEGDRMTHALNLLEANGYGDFSNFQQSGKDFAATVKRDGQQFGVIVNPDTNQITRQG